MKKIFILLATCFLLPVFSFACDICGCGVGNNYIGILPEFHKHIFGVRYRYNSLLTHVGIGGVPSYLTTTERYQTMELWAGWNITNKFRVMANVPYGFNERTNQGIAKNKNGIGDISAAAYYQLIGKKKQLGERLLVQSLWIGAGIKLATGTYNPSDKSGATNTNLFQLGTGSTDITTALMYDVRLQDIGLNISANYKINGSNKYHYAYGDKLSLSSQLYYKFNIRNKLTLSPNAGIMYERGAVDHDNGFKVTASGGNVLLASAGLETVIKRIAIGANYQLPVSQNLANKIVSANNRLMIHIGIAL